MFSRRQVCVGISVTGLGAVAGRVAAETTLEERLAELETRYGGKLGVAILNTQTNRLVAHRGNERFPFCSVIKLPTAAFVLARVDRGQERLDRRVTYGRSDLITYSPATEKYLDTGMTIGAICEAAVTLSDNTAQNLLLGSFGGPAALTGFMRSMGDEVTRSDRPEPDLNTVPVGDVRDTTSPVAMTELMRQMLTTDALSRGSRDQLAAWLTATATGNKRLRAGTPPGWRAGDKTGTGPAPRNATNDAAVFYPPNRAPIFVTALYVDSPASLDDRQAVLAEVGRLAVTI